MSDADTKELAEVFGVSVVLNSNLVDGSLRESAVKNQTKILLYEAGEALRFDEFSIRAGMKGILNILQHLGITRKSPPSKKKKVVPFIANGSQWVRANASGIVHNIVNLGDQITKGQVLAEIGSPYGAIFDSVIATRSGILIGKQNIPLEQEGEAMFHIAYFSEDDEEIAGHIAGHIENVQEQLSPENKND
jgi:predicted deacylase